MVSYEHCFQGAKVKSIKILYAYHLFIQGHYDRAMEYFHEQECDPLQVLGLFPNLLPREIRAKYSYPPDIPDQNQLSSLFLYFR